MSPCAAGGPPAPQSGEGGALLQRGKTRRNSHRVRDRRLTKYARVNRQTMSDAERLVWSHLRYNRLGVKFRRQHPIGPYIADFACVSQRIVVEIDGSQHRESQYDLTRDAHMRSLGWVVLRFWAWDVVENLEGVLAGIADCLNPDCPPAQRADNPT